MPGGQKNRLVKSRRRLIDPAGVCIADGGLQRGKRGLQAILDLGVGHARAGGSGLGLQQATNVIDLLCAGPIKGRHHRATACLGFNQPLCLKIADRLAHNRP